MSTATVNNQAIDDIYAEAMAAPVASRHFYGQVILVDVWPCVLQKGVGKVAWDAQQHSASDKRVAIVIHVEVQGRDGAYTIKQDTINTAKDWTKTTLPSLNALGANLRDLKGQYCHIERVPTGETYQGREGDTRDRTAIKFVELFSDEDTCRAAADKFYGHAPNTNGHTPAASPPAASTAERTQLAEQFLPVLWQAANKDKAVFLGMIAANPLLAKHFNEQSPEIVDILLPF